MATSNVVFSFYDPELDSPAEDPKEQKWRPTISLLSDSEFKIDRLVFLVDPKFETAGDKLIEEFATTSPGTVIEKEIFDIEDIWDYAEVFAYLYDLSERYAFTESESYYTHMSTGTHVFRICWYLLIEARLMPAKMLQSFPIFKEGELTGAGIRDLDLELEKYDQLAKRFEKRRNEGKNFLKQGIQTKNAHFNALIDEIERVAKDSKRPILITGPTGAGKTELAKRIFELKKNRNQIKGEFIHINCATLRGDGAMSTLFGHKRGAFTGAVQKRDGLLLAANNGLLFLDEIGELGPEEQTMLLTALETGKFYPIGSDREEESSFLLIAGSNRDLRKDASQGKFRRDLLARIDLWHYELPGLKDRIEDLEPNLEYELDQVATELGHQVSFNKTSRSSYLKYAKSLDAQWSGNFRDLNASIVRMSTFAEGGRITTDIVDKEIKRLKIQDKSHNSESPKDINLEEFIKPEVLDTKDTFDLAQLKFVIATCIKCKNISEAGRLLFNKSRKEKKSNNDADRLIKYLAGFEIEFKDLKRLSIS